MKIEGAVTAMITEYPFKQLSVLLYRNLYINIVLKQGSLMGTTVSSALITLDHPHLPNLTIGRQATP